VKCVDLTPSVNGKWWIFSPKNREKGDSVPYPKFYYRLSLIKKGEALKPLISIAKKIIKRKKKIANNSKYNLITNKYIFLYFS